MDHTDNKITLFEFVSWMTSRELKKSDWQKSYENFINNLKKIAPGRWLLENVPDTTLRGILGQMAAEIEKLLF